MSQQYPKNGPPKGQVCLLCGQLSGLFQITDCGKLTMNEPPQCGRPGWMNYQGFSALEPGRGE